MEKVQSFSVKKAGLSGMFECFKDFKEIITRAELIDVGLDPNLYLNDENEIFICDIVAAAKLDYDYEHLLHKEIFNTCKLLDVYNKKNKDKNISSLKKAQA